MCIETDYKQNNIGKNEKDMRQTWVNRINRKDMRRAEYHECYCGQKIEDMIPFGPSARQDKKSEGQTEKCRQCKTDIVQKKANIHP